MAEVTVVSSCMVRPENINKSGRTKIHLTPYDLKLMNFSYPQRGLLFPKPDPETHFIPRLKASLSTALEIFSLFAGRLVKVNNTEDSTVSFYIDCDSSGAKFVHAKAESVFLNDLLHSHDHDFKRCFFPANDLKSSDGLSQPLLLLQVTELEDGVFISFGYNHMVADGSSFWSFFHTWSKICLNSSSSSLNIQPVVLKDWFLEGIDYPIHIPDSETKIPQRFQIPTKEKVFHFTKSKISDLKAKASHEDAKISSLQAVLAHLWLSILKQSGLTREEETHCIVAADMRKRLNPPLEPECFGNVTHQAMATATVGKLIDHGLGWAALQINEQVRSLTHENYKTFGENWVRNLKSPKPSGGNGNFGTYFVVTSSPWFKVYDNDFGWGKPIAVRSEPGNGLGVSLVVFRGFEEGSIDVHATIPLSLWSDELMTLSTDV